MAARQFGSLRAVRAEEGIGEMAVELVVSAYRGFGLWIPALARVTMGCGAAGAAGALTDAGGALTEDGEAPTEGAAIEGDAVVVAITGEGDGVVLVPSGGGFTAAMRWFGRGTAD